MSYPTSFFKSWRWTLIDFFDLLVDIDGINESSSTNQLTKFCGSSYLIYYLLIIIQDTKKTVLMQYFFWILVISWLVNDADDVYEKVGKTNLYPLFGKIWSSLCMANKRQFYIVYITTISFLWCGDSGKPKIGLILEKEWRLTIPLRFTCPKLE